MNNVFINFTNVSLDELEAERLLVKQQQQLGVQWDELGNLKPVARKLQYNKSSWLRALPKPAAPSQQPVAPTESVMYRVEADSLGEVLVPAEVYYGAQTARAVSNFSGLNSGTTLGQLPGFVRAIAQIKKASALANHADGRLPKALCDAIVCAADELLADKSPIGEENFPVDMV